MELWLEHFARATLQRSADTAHDLKTPLNVAVLNLELLRMRLQKLGAGEDEKIAGYLRAVEGEMRRLGRIFDAYFLLSIPPKNEVASGLDVIPIVAEEAEIAGFALHSDGSAVVLAHPSRIRHAYRLFFEGASKLFPEREAIASAELGRHAVSVTGTPAAPDFDPSKIFKLYYSDSEGNPDLSLSVARLVAETYGGELNAVQDRDKVILRLSLPLGAE